MRFRELIALGVFGLVGIVSTARLAWASSEHYYDFVSKVTISEGHNLRINCKGNCRNDDNCSNPWYAVSQHDLTNDLTRAQLQVALASFLGQKKVFIGTNGCQVGGNDDGYLLLDTIQLEQP